MFRYLTIQYNHDVCTDATKISEWLYIGLRQLGHLYLVFSVQAVAC